MHQRLESPRSAPPAAFGALLRQARIAAALSQEALAERSGLSARAISDLERGIHRFPRLETVRLLATALEVDDNHRLTMLAAARPGSGNSRPMRPPIVVLPVPATPLIGREREITDIYKLLWGEETRLLTLTGPGGSGKTRVAIAAAQRLSDQFGDGVVFVDLAPLSDPAHVPAIVAQELGIKDPHGLGPEEALHIHLSDSRMLLVLDNFEHLLSSAPFIARLLASAPAVKVLATSREPLRLRGERVFSVAPLALPSPVDPHDLAKLGACDSVAVFVARSRDAQHDFALTSANVAAVVEICRRLDGLPLALELAAARMRVLAPHALQLRLEAALPLLTGGARDAPARHRTLRETIAWSYNLLGSDEQQLFRALGSFVGGWTLDAAEAVAGLEGKDHLFERLSSLVEKNLVRLDTASAEPRFAMLETIREFALEQLTASGEEHAVRDRHAAWCIAFGEVAEPALEGFGGTQAAWLARLDRELGNVRAALGWLDRSGDSCRLLRLLTVLDTYWFQRPQQHREIGAWLERGLRDPDIPPSVRAPALHVAVAIAQFRGAWQEVMMHAEVHLAVAESWGEAFELGRACFNLGSALMTEGDLERAAAMLDQAVTRFREVNAASWIYLALADLGSTFYLRGDLERAVSLLDEALVLVRQEDGNDPFALRDTLSVCQLLGKRAHAACEQGELALAAQMFVDELAIANEHGATREALGALAGLGGVALGCQEPVRAARLLGAVDAARETEGLATIADFLFVRHVEIATCDALGEAAFSTQWHEGRAMPIEQAVADALALAEAVQRPVD